MAITDSTTDRMIRAAKENLRVGRFNAFLLWGYVTVAVSVVEYALIALTENGMWMWGWFAIPLIGYPLQWRYGHTVDEEGDNYVERLVGHIWQVMKLAFLLTAVFVSLSTLSWLFLLPLTLILCAVGVSLTGAVLQERAMMACPFLSLCAGLYMLTDISHGGMGLAVFLYFAAAFAVMLIVPGHLLFRRGKA